MSNKLSSLHNLTSDEVHNKGVLLGKFSTLIKNTYSVWIIDTEESEGQNTIVLIDEDDNEIAGVLEGKTGNILYLHPRSVDAVMKLWNI